LNHRRSKEISMSDTTTDTAHLHDLTLTRDIAASPAALFRCWTDPALIPQWFCPPPGASATPRPTCAPAAPA